jgi:hypothetical protein
LQQIAPGEEKEGDKGGRRGIREEGGIRRGGIRR